jgi:hypothetical protein
MRGILAGLLLLAAGLACREAALRLAPTPADHAHAVDMLGAMAARFGPIEREPAFDALRPKLARAALVPSRVFGDASAWTVAVGPERTVEFWGRGTEGCYRIGVRADAPAPSEPGAYRGMLRLRRLGDGAFEWRMSEELALGGIRVHELADALTAVFRAAEGSSEAGARREIRLALPRTAAAFGRLVSLETLALTPAPAGGTSVLVGLRLTPDGIRAESPRYAAFLDRYATPIQLKAVVRDRAGARWWELEMRDKRATLRLRVHGGDLAPLDGSPRSLPADLRVRVDYSTKAGLFRVGVEGLEADVTLVRDPREKAFRARFLRPPDWKLPFLIEPFLRSSLRYPFEGEGSLLGFYLHEQDEGPTLVKREYGLGVKESWLVRWLGGLGSAAVDDFRRGAEAEADRFTGEALSSLQADVRALLEESTTGPPGSDGCQARAVCTARSRPVPRQNPIDRVRQAASLSAAEGCGSRSWSPVGLGPVDRRSSRAGAELPALRHQLAYSRVRDRSGAMEFAVGVKSACRFPSS